MTVTNLAFHDIGDTDLGCNFGIQVYPTEGLKSGPDSVDSASLLSIAGTNADCEHYFGNFEVTMNKYIFLK